MIISRFILDLRGVYYPTERTQVSTINFATGTIAGNFGAPLRTDSTWISGPMDDDDDVEVSHEPFIAGLAPSEIEVGMEMQSELPSPV